MTKQRVNNFYCSTCGGLQSYQEMDVTMTASAGAITVEVFPERPEHAANAAPTTLSNERICGCAHRTAGRAG